MAEFSVQTSVIAGLALTFNNANAGGDTFTNDGRTIIVVYNTSGAQRTVTVTTTQVVETTLNVDDRAVTVDNNTYKMIGPFSQSVYSSTVTLAYDSATNVTVAVLKTS